MRFGFIVLAALVCPAPAFAGCPDGCPPREAPEVSTNWGGDAEAPTRIILSNPSHSYGGPIWGALEIDVAPGWFVYATKASASAAPEFDWSGSVNLGPVDMRWPPPAQADIDGHVTAVYRGHIILPISIAPQKSREPIELKLQLSYAVCGEVCRPATSTHTIRIAAEPLPVPAAAERFAQMIIEALIAADMPR